MEKLDLEDFIISTINKTKFKISVLLNGLKIETIYEYDKDNHIIHHYGSSLYGMGFGAVAVNENSNKELSLELINRIADGLCWLSVEKEQIWQEKDDPSFLVRVVRRVVTSSWELVEIDSNNIFNENSYDLLTKYKRIDHKLQVSQTWRRKDDPKYKIVIDSIHRLNVVGQSVNNFFTIRIGKTNFFKNWEIYEN